MPKGVYKRTKEHLDHCKNVGFKKGVHYSFKTEFKKGHKIGLGKHLSEETKRKISETQKGKVYFGRGKWMIGRKQSLELVRKRVESRKGYNHTEETKNKISLANKGKKRPKITGEKNSSWKGGITPENTKIRNSIEFDLWREAVYARDNWTCQICGEKGGNLNAHHIKNFSQFSELRLAINNGQTLCKKCHRKFHNRYGYKDNNQEQLDDQRRKTGK